MKKGGIAHEKTLQIYKTNLELIGHRIIDLEGKSPDLIDIFIKNGKIIVNCIDAINVQTKGIKPRSKYDNHYHANLKKKSYLALGFDDVEIVRFTTN